MARLLIFGDSITYGAWDVKQSGWASRIRHHLDERAESDPDFYTCTYNLGIPGETTRGLLKRFKSEAEARAREDDDNMIFVFAYGANDAAMVPSEKRFRVSIEQFGNNLEAVIATARGFSPKLLFVNIAPVVDSKTKNPPGKDSSRLNEYIEPYNRKLEWIAQKYSVPLVDVNAAFMKRGCETLIDPGDGLHPNEKGHLLIFEEVIRELNKFL